MKKYFLGTLLLMLSHLLSAQVADSTYASVTFFGGDMGSYSPIKIFIGDQPPFVLSGNQAITFKFYNKKGSKIEYHNNGVFSFHNKFFLTVEKGKTYYYVADFSDTYHLFSESDVNGYNKKIKKITDIKVIYEDPSIVAEKSTKPYSSGTGFLISSNGYLVTNSHVIDKAVKITVRGIGGDFATKYPVKLIANDKANDIALLKVDNTGLKLDSIPFALRSSGVETGEEIFVLGYPLKTVMGEEIKLTTGVVSSKSGFEGNFSTFQISAMVQPGNSGSPLFDRNGNLIGIVNAKLQGTEAVNYAIKISYLRSLLESSETPSGLKGKPATVTTPLVDLVKKYSTFIYIIETEK